MTPKQYTAIKLAAVIAIGAAVGFSIVRENYYLPVAIIASSTLLLLGLRKRVSGVIEDERDYLIGGKAALFAMQAFGWVAIILVFALLSFKHTNPDFETIATTIAYSACLMLIFYSLGFLYYSKLSFSTKRNMYLIFGAVAFLFLVVVSLRSFSGEDGWICEKGNWVKHGSPNFPAPTTVCK